MGLPRLDAAAVWVLGALGHLQRAGRPASRNAGEWVDTLSDLIEHCRRIENDEEPPANRCPLVTVRMPVETNERPQPGEWIAASYADRELWAADNRRLVGSVARALIDYVDLQQRAAVQYRAKAESEDSSAAAEKAEQLAREVRARAQAALRGVDLQSLDRAVGIEISAEGAGTSIGESQAAEPPSSSPSTEPELEVVFENDKRAIVCEGNTTVTLRGERTVWVFRQVVEARGRTVRWVDLVRADIARSAEGLDGGLDATNSVAALRPDSFQRAGNRIRKDLGKLAYHWHQDGQGACWSSDAA